MADRPHARLSVSIGLIGDRDDSVIAHRAIPRALQMAAAALNCELIVEWLPTERLSTLAHLEHQSGLWCVPASPYRSMDGALAAIRFAREQEVPFLGTCGGFQHAVLEFALNMLKWDSVRHAEIDPEARDNGIISPLNCALVETGEDLRIDLASKLGRAYGESTAREEYHCRYGLNPLFADRLFTRLLRPVAWNSRGEIRALELDEHPFFVATLFQPERLALAGRVPPLALAFIEAAISRARRCQLLGDANAQVVNTSRGTFWLSDRSSLIDSMAAHEFLTRSHWAQGISHSLVAKSIEHSICVGIYDSFGRQVGMGRVVTDQATFAYLCDVYVLEPHRGLGLSHQLIKYIQSRPELSGLRRFLLATKDAHELYSRHGFAPLSTPQRFMEIYNPSIYTTASKDQTRFPNQIAE